MSVTDLTAKQIGTLQTLMFRHLESLGKSMDTQPGRVRMGWTGGTDGHASLSVDSTTPSDEHLAAREQRAADFAVLDDYAKTLGLSTPFT